MRTHACLCVHEVTVYFVHMHIHIESECWMPHSVTPHLIHSFTCFQDRISHTTWSSFIPLYQLCKLRGSLSVHVTSIRIISASCCIEFYVGTGDPNSSPLAYMTSTSQAKPFLLSCPLHNVYKKKVPQQSRNQGLILIETWEGEVEICRCITKDRVSKIFRCPKVGSFQHTL